MTDRDGEDQAFVDAISEWPDINDGPTLAGFLLARIAEDEALLKAWRGLPDYLQGRGDWQIREWESDESGGMSIPEARLAAECEAKRRIVERYAEHAEYDDEENSYEHATGRIVGLGEAVRLLAAPYADHPDYRRAWRP